MKKLIASLLAVVLTFGLFGAMSCGATGDNGGQNNGQNDEPADTTEYEVTLIFENDDTFKPLNFGKFVAEGTEVFIQNLEDDEYFFEEFVGANGVLKIDLRKGEYEVYLTGYKKIEFTVNGKSTVNLDCKFDFFADQTIENNYLTNGELSLKDTVFEMPIAKYEDSLIKFQVAKKIVYFETAITARDYAFENAVIPTAGAFGTTVAIKTRPFDDVNYTTSKPNEWLGVSVYAQDGVASNDISQRTWGVKVINEDFDFIPFESVTANNFGNQQKGIRLGVALVGGTAHIFIENAQGKMAFAGYVLGPNCVTVDGVLRYSESNKVLGFKYATSFDFEINPGETVYDLIDVTEVTYQNNPSATERPFDVIEESDSSLTLSGVNTTKDGAEMTIDGINIFDVGSIVINFDYVYSRFDESKDTDNHTWFSLWITFNYGTSDEITLEYCMWKGTLHIKTYADGSSSDKNNFVINAVTTTDKNITNLPFGETANVNYALTLKDNERDYLAFFGKDSAGKYCEMKSMEAYSEITNGNKSREEISVTAIKSMKIKFDKGSSSNAPSEWSINVKINKGI